MILVTHHLVTATNACIGYTQSDEISLVWFTDEPKSQIFMDGKRDKMVSLLAAMTSVRFNEHLPAYLPAKARAITLPYRESNLPIFDARVWQVPTKVEAANYLRWRERDAVKNSIAMAAQQHFSHRALHKKNGSDMQDMLHSVGINWNDYPSFFKRGTYVQRRLVALPFSAEELAKLPPKHEAHTNPDLEVVRRQVKTIAMPRCSSISNFVDVIFDGAEPIVKQ